MTDQQFLSKFEDFASVFCTENEIETQLLTGSLPEGATVADMARAMDALKAMLVARKDEILALRKLDRPGSDMLEITTEVQICSKIVIITAEVTNAGDPDDDSNDWFIVTPGFAIK